MERPITFFLCEAGKMDVINRGAAILLESLWLKPSNIIAGLKLLIFRPSKV